MVGLIIMYITAFYSITQGRRVRGKPCYINGDRIYNQWDEDAIQTLIEVV